MSDPFNGKRGDWMQTYTGRAFYPAHPRSSEIFIEDIAHALSLLCRYGGHCNRFYSVAEHSVLVSHMVPEVYALDGLMHDAPEAYLVDIPRPAKVALPQYKAMEEKVWKAILQRYPRLFVNTPNEVHAADNAILFSERDANMKPPPYPWSLKDPGFRVPIHFWSPKKAERMFLARYRELMNTQSTWEGAVNFVCNYFAPLKHVA